MYGSLADKDTSAYSNTRITCIYEVRVFTRIHGSQMVYHVFRYLVMIYLYVAVPYGSVFYSIEFIT